MFRKTGKRILAVICVMAMLLQIEAVNIFASELSNDEIFVETISNEEIVPDENVTDVVAEMEQPEELSIEQEEVFADRTEIAESVDPGTDENSADFEKIAVTEEEPGVTLSETLSEGNLAYTISMTGAAQVITLSPKESGVYEFAEDLNGTKHCKAGYTLSEDGKVLASAGVYDEWYSGLYASFMLEAGKTYSLSIEACEGTLYVNKLQKDPFTVENGVLTAVDLRNVDYLILPEGITEISDSGYSDIMSKNHINGSVVFPSSLETIKISYLSESMGTWSRLINFIVAAGNKNYQSLDGILYTADGDKLLRVPGSRSGTLLVPGNPSVIGENAFLYSELTEVILPDSVEEVGTDAFFLARSLKKVTFGNRLKTIGFGAFSDTGLTEVELPDSVISIDRYAFRCSHNGWSDGTPLASIKLSASLQSIGDNAFEGAALTEVDLPDSLTEIGAQAFKDNLLSEIDLPAAIEYIGSEAFAGCSKLTKATIRTNGDIGGLFDETDNLEKITLGKNVTRYAMTKDEWLYEGGYSAHYWTGYPNYDYKTIVGNRLLFVPGKVEIGTFNTTGYVSIADTFFDHLTGVRNLNVGSSTIDFSEIVLPELKEISVSSDNPVYYSANGVLFMQDSYGGGRRDCLVCYPSGKTDATYTVPDTIDYICDYAFCNYGTKARKLQSITIPEYTKLGYKVFSTEHSEIEEPVLTINGYSESIASYNTYAYDYYRNNYERENLAWNYIGVKSVTVTFNPNKGSVSVKKQTVSPEAAYGTLPTPTRKYYLFTGWYTAKSGGTKVTKNTICSKTSNHTLYAHWKKCDLAKAEVTVKNVTWTGKSLTPAVSVKFNNKTLKKGTDYTVTYSNNKEPGKKAKVVVKGIGNYAKSSGSVTKYFTINKATQNLKLSEKINRKANELGKALTLKPVVKENAKITYSVKNKKIVKVSGKNKLTSLKPGKTTVTVTVAATKHYNKQTFNITYIQQGTLNIKLTSKTLTYSSKTKEYSMNGTYTPVSLGVKIQEKNTKGKYTDITGVKYTATLQNVTGGGGTINGDKVSVPFKGQVKVTVTTAKTAVYPSKTATFTINVKSFSEGQIDTDKNWKVAQNADGTFTVLKYVGSKTEIALPETIVVGLQRKKITAIGPSAFVGTKVKKVELASSAVKEISEKAFRNVTTLTHVSLPADLTALGAQAFEGCSKLTEIYLSDKLLSVPEKVFKGCEALTEVSIPASAKMIGANAFDGCKKVAKIHITTSTKTISVNAFNGCTGLTDVYYGGSKAAFSEIAKKNSGNSALLSATIHSYSDGSAAPKVSSVSNSELFVNYTDYLQNDGFFHMTNDLYNKMHGIMASFSPADVARAAFKEEAKKGIAFCIQAIVDDTAGLGWMDDKLNKKLAMELILSIENSIDYQDKFDEEYEAYMKENGLYQFDKLYEIAKEFEDVPNEVFADGDTRYLMARKLAAFFNESGHSRGDASEWNKALKVVGAEWETISKCMGYVDDASKLADNVIDFVFVMITLQDISENTVTMLLKEVPKDSNLYDGLIQIQDTMNSPISEWIAEYAKDWMLSKISKQIVKLGTNLLDHAMKTKGYGVGTMTAIASAFWEAAGTVIGSGVDLEAMNNGWVTLANTSMLKSSVETKISEMRAGKKNGVSPSAEQISSFETVMTAYLSSLIQTEKYVASNITNPNEKMKLDALLTRYQKAFQYQSYLNSCKQNVLGL